MRPEEKRGCDNCEFIGSDDAGGDYSPSYPVCDKHPSYSCLKNFPFKNGCKSFQLGFWASEFADQVYTGGDSLEDDGYTKAYQLYREKYGAASLKEKSP